jgi:fimbrial chaperone protein
MRAALVAALVIGIAGGMATDAHASGNFQVEPTRVELDATAATAAVTITNRGAGKLRLQMSAMTWRDDEGGVMQLAPTTDVIVRPELVAIDPGATRTVRVAVVAKGAAGVERSYRVFFEELPDRTATETNRIRVLARIGVPVFVAGAKGAAAAAVPAVSGDGGVVTVVNGGGRFVKLGKIAVTATSGGANGAVRWTHAATGWYVLAGARRWFEVPMGADRCRAGDRVTVAIEAEDGTHLATSAPVACEP